MAPGAQAAVLMWDHRQDDFASWESEYIRIKIFDRGAAKYGDVELPFMPGYSWIKDLQARTIHADGTVVPFNGKTFDWPLLENRFTMTRAIKVPQLAAHLDLLHPARALWKLR